MSNGHTPGPWILALGRDGAPRGLRGPAEVEHRNIINWNGFSSPTKPASIANARLITAAPELLEALEALLIAYCDPGNQGGDHDDKVEAARAALAKARGTPC